MRPERDFCRNVNKSELASFRLPRQAIMAIDNLELEEGVIVPTMVVLWPSCDFLVCGHGRRSHVVSEEVALGAYMKKLDNIFIPDNTASASLRKGFGRNDLPKIIRVIMSIASHLLS